jgi:hypothetical protein
MQPHVSQSKSCLGKLLQPGNEVQQKVGITVSIVDNISVVIVDSITKTKLKLTPVTQIITANTTSTATRRTK